MMKTRLTTLVLALLGGAFAAAPTQPVPGPGGVATAVLRFLERQDQGGDVGALLVDRDRDAEFVLDADGALQLAESPCVSPFSDVAEGGRPFDAKEAAAFAALLKKCAATCEAAGRAVRSEVRGMRCDCDSERCSLAVVEFDRVYSKDGVETARVPMRATALLQYVGGDGVPFRIYHWHASRAGQPRELPAGK